MSFTANQRNEREVRPSFFFLTKNFDADAQAFPLDSGVEAPVQGEWMEVNASNNLINPTAADSDDFVADVANFRRHCYPVWLGQTDNASPSADALGKYPIIMSSGYRAATTRFIGDIADFLVGESLVVAKDDGNADPAEQTRGKLKRVPQANLSVGLLHARVAVVSPNNSGADNDGLALAVPPTVYLVFEKV